VWDLVDDPAALAGRVESVREYLASGGGRVPRRVAASVAQLGVAARLISPSLGAAVHSGRYLAFRREDVWWQAELGGAFPLAVSGRPAGSPDSLLAFLGRLVEVAATFSVSRKVLWGNVGSAVNGAATMIGVARPDLAPRAIAVADELLSLPPLRGTGDRGAGVRFHRRSCCLIYQASPGASRSAVCGDCVLAAP
jgi:hypothetical protein